jgi:hypothetical protein
MASLYASTDALAASDPPGDSVVVDVPQEPKMHRRKQHRSERHAHSSDDDDDSAEGPRTHAPRPMRASATMIAANRVVRRAHSLEYKDAGDECDKPTEIALCTLLVCLVLVIIGTGLYFMTTHLPESDTVTVASEAI